MATRFDSFLQDPQAGAYFERELDHVRSQVYEYKTPPQNAMQLIPQAGDVESWRQTYTHRMCEFVGKAQFISDYADDLPLVDAHGEEATYNIKTFGVAYKFSRDEILRGSKTSLRLDEKRPRAARIAIEQKFNRIQFYGDPSAGIFGWLNFPYIPRQLLTIDFDSSQSAQDILAAMNDFVNSINELTDTIAQPELLLMPPVQYNYVATTPLGSGSDTTILTHFKNNNPYITDVRNVQELRGAGPSGEDVMIAYRRANENGEHKLVEPFTQLAPQDRNLAVITNCVAKSGGFVTDYPLEMVIGEFPL